MKNLSIALLLLLTSCQTVTKHKEDFREMGHEAMDEEFDKVMQELEKDQMSTRVVEVK